MDVSTDVVEYRIIRIQKRSMVVAGTGVLLPKPFPLPHCSSTGEKVREVTQQEENTSSPPCLKKNRIYIGNKRREEKIFLFVVCVGKGKRHMMDYCQIFMACTWQDPKKEGHTPRKGHVQS